MKTLFVLRHAKSSWDDDAIDDIDRPLSRRGANDTKRLATHMARERVRPDLVCCSPAVRTRATLDAIQESLQKPKVVFEDALYGAGAHELVDYARSLPPDADTVMLIGHNPGFADFVSVLTRAQLDFPSGALATVELSVDSWSALRPGKAELRSLVVPKQLPD